MIDQTYADELVPTTGVIAQAQAFDRLGQRYDLFIHTGGDHLAFAVEDRFGDAVAVVGHPVRAVDPGTITYSWYPSLDDSALGIGATGDYWITGLAARSGAYGTIATVRAADAALPDPAVTVERSGPALVTQPLPGTETALRWKLGPRPAPRPQMTLTLVDVSALDVDARAARLQTGTITISSDGDARLTISRLPTGTEVLARGRVLARVDRLGSAAVTLGGGTTVLELVRSASVRRRGRPRRVRARPRPAPSFTG